MNQYRLNTTLGSFTVMARSVNEAIAQFRVWWGGDIAPAVVDVVVVHVDEGSKVSA